MLTCTGLGVSCAVAPYLGTVAIWRASARSWRASISVDVTCRYPTPIAGVWLMSHQLGSGFVIGPKGAITARHVLECVALPDGESGNVVITTSDGRRIKVDGALPALVPQVDAVRLNLAERVELESYPRPTHRRYINATACMMAQAPAPGVECGRLRRAGDLLMAFWMVRHGNSGAGIFDAAGDIVGITTGRLGSLGGIGWPSSSFDELWGAP